MNIFKKELKQGRFPFLLWSTGIAFLVLGGMVKFSGISGTEGGGLNVVLSQLPRPVLAVFGMTETNIETFGGFYAVLQFYAMITVSCYAVWLGTNAVLRESMDKTYEFLFTKPRTRSYILTVKLSAGWFWLTALCLLNGVCSYLAPGLYGIENDIPGEMMLFVFALYVVALLFFALGAALSVWAGRSEKAVGLSYHILLLSYGLSVVFDMDEKLGLLRFFTPFKYFRAGELLEGQFSAGFLAVAFLLAAALITGAYLGFRRKDLNAV